MTIELSKQEFRSLLDLVYIGNWVLNSTRSNDRIEEYDQVESKLFGLCQGTNLQALVEQHLGVNFPSRAFTQGGIHEAIAYYEDEIFFEILAEELSRRDMGYPDLTADNYSELTERMEKYMQEFDVNGIENLSLEGM